ncbi:MAG: DUF1573 domain-containing protein [Ignavibacteria bacterium]|nr:DUF1573 domain-containing protein [Ignavibacteria bacterium]
MKNLITTKTANPSYFLFEMMIIVTTMSILISSSEISASSGTAKILFTEESHDFGNVEQGEQLEYSFAFTNEGEAPLLIQNVQPACGCTGATVGEKTEYAKGESGEIKITFNTQGRDGHQEKSITVFTNDTESPEKVLKFSCDIK